MTSMLDALKKIAAQSASDALGETDSSEVVQAGLRPEPINVQLTHPNSTSAAAERPEAHEATDPNHGPLRIEASAHVQTSETANYESDTHDPASQPTQDAEIERATLAVPETESQPTDEHQAERPETDNGKPESTVVSATDADEALDAGDQGVEAEPADEEPTVEQRLERAAERVDNLVEAFIEQADDPRRDETATDEPAFDDVGLRQPPYEDATADEPSFADQVVDNQFDGERYVADNLGADHLAAGYANVADNTPAFDPPIEPSAADFYDHDAVEPTYTTESASEAPQPVDSVELETPSAENPPATSESEQPSDEVAQPEDKTAAPGDKIDEPEFVAQNGQAEALAEESDPFVNPPKLADDERTDIGDIPRLYLNTPLWNVGLDASDPTQRQTFAEQLIEIDDKGKIIPPADEDESPTGESEREPAVPAAEDATVPSQSEPETGGVSRSSADQCAAVPFERTLAPEEIDTAVAVADTEADVDVDAANLFEKQEGIGNASLVNETAALAGDSGAALSSARLLVPQAPVSAAADGESAAKGEPANGELANGESANREPADGEPANGEPANGEPADGEPADGEPADGEPADGEPADGEPATGEEPATDEDSATDEEPVKIAQFAFDTTAKATDDAHRSAASTSAEEPTEAETAYEADHDGPVMNSESDANVAVELESAIAVANSPDDATLVPISPVVEKPIVPRKAGSGREPTAFEAEIRKMIFDPIVGTQIAEMFERIADDCPVHGSFVLLSSQAESHVAEILSCMALVNALGNKKNVLLVDANPERPALSDGFSLAKAPGFADACVEKSHWKSVVQPTATARLTILPAGSPLSDLSNRSPIISILGEMAAEYDMVMVDGGKTDSQFAESLCRATDRTYLLVRLGKTPRELAGSAVDSLRNNGIEINGTVVTNVPVGEAR